jgi:hypothetical protein
MNMSPGRLDLERHFGTLLVRMERPTAILRGLRCEWEHRSAEPHAKGVGL